MATNNSTDFDDWANQSLSSQTTHRESFYAVLDAFIIGTGETVRLLRHIQEEDNANTEVFIAENCPEE